jgi:thiol-disulfide isomerase/thioredoxin
MCYHILIILVVLLVLIRFIPQSPFEGFTNTPKTVVICKAEWCGHCKQAAPEFEQLVNASPITLTNGNKVNVKMLDADADKSAISKYKIRGYPTILIMNGDSDQVEVEYPGERTYDSVIRFLNEM